MTLTLALQIATIALVLVVPFIRGGKTPGLMTSIGVVLFTASYFISNIWQLAFVSLEPPHAYGLALRLYTLSGLLLVVVYVSTVFWLLRRQPKIDLEARLIWLVLLIAESIAVVEYLECKVFVDPFGSGDLMLSKIWGIEVSRFACGRRFGVVAPYIAPIMSALYLIWIRWRASKIKG